MAGNPKDNGNKITAIIKAWKDLRPTKSFAGMTLAQFTAKVQPSLDARTLIGQLDDQMTAATVERDNNDVVSLAEVLLVVNSVKGDPAEGEDGELYAAFGYVRKSERKTGKTNKPSKKAPLGP